MTEILAQDEINQLLSAISSGDTEIDETNAQVQEAQRIKIYDFKRPDKFSKEQIRTFSMLHEVLARLTTTSLSGQLRSLAQVRVASVDQLTYEEFIRSMPNPTTLAVINMNPLKGSIVFGIDSAVTFSIIDRLFGGQGAAAKVIRELTEIEKTVMEGIIVRMLSNIREAWGQVIDLRPRLSQIETNPQFAQIVPPTEMAVVVTLEARVKDIEGMMIVCIPYLTIEPIASKLSAQYWYASSRRGTGSEHVSSLRSRLQSIEIPIIAEIGRMNVNMADVLNMKVGDVFRLLDNKITESITLRVGDQMKFLCRPGCVGNKVGVQIVEHIKGEDSAMLDSQLFTKEQEEEVLSE